MTKAHVKKTIGAAFNAIARAAESNQEANSLLTAAFEAAEECERQHRKMVLSMDGYQQSVATTARYFVAKWFSEGPNKVMSARQACAMRLDRLYGTALRECLDDRCITIDIGADFALVDYCSHIVG